MGPLKLYRLLQGLVGSLNNLVVALYKEEITAEDALAQSTKQIEQIITELKS
ncbi:MAG: hypothetical protein L7F78_22970 [Syntrophales bacterium LBB04]|nr:hypothetical protein [Syntrophales bacterium LBB04]